MHNRPRCRDWTPLATQQLRLRNLIKIIGQNIICSPKSQLYFTLHSSAMSAPFFTSEKVDPHGTGIADWPEISCHVILKSTARSVCIRVWERQNPVDNEEQTESRLSSDKMLFIWGVYFSGLVLLTKRTEAKFLPNSLAFQMQGGYFASPETLTRSAIQQQLIVNYEMEHHIKSIDERSVKPPFDRSSIREDTHKKAMITNDDTKSYNESEFNVNLKMTGFANAERSENIKSDFYSDLHEGMLKMLKCRYIEKYFLKSEVRSSYTLGKLLKIQEKQRKFKQKNEHAKEIVEKICMKSAYCLNLDLISNRAAIYYQPKGNPSMGRALNRLLFEERRISPEEILKSQNLRRQIETARFKSQLLSQERDRVKTSLRYLEKRLGELHDSNIEKESWLMTNYRNLCRENDALMSEKVLVLRKRETLMKMQKALRQRRLQLCRELKDIYPIENIADHKYAINNVILPNAECLSSENKMFGLDVNMDAVSPLSLSVGLGYVAHVVQMCSIIYNLPLRNPIKHEGSRSRILDIIKDLPNASREFPLYCRTTPLPKAVFYAVYLLNQNIAQLNYQIHNIKCDLREILPNVLHLLDGNNLIELGIVTDEKDQKPSISGSFTELTVPVPTVISEPVNVTDKKVVTERISRSVGSYSDDQILSGGKDIYNSEPILNARQMQLSDFSENCNI